MLAIFRTRHRPDTQRLSALLDGRLDGPARQRLEAHVAACEACRVRLAALRETRDALRSLPDVEPPRSFRLRAADVRTVPAPRPAPRLVRAMPVLAAAAAIVFAAVLGFDLTRGGGAENSATPQTLQAMSAGARAATSARGGAPAFDSNVPSTAAGAAAAPDAAPPGGETVLPGPGSSGGAGSAPAPIDVTPGSAPGALAPAPPTLAAVSPPAATPSNARQAVVAPTSSSTSVETPANASSGGGHAGYRIAEVLAAVAALAAGATSVYWRVRSRKV